MALIDNQGEDIWRLPKAAHHNPVLSADQKRLLLLTQDYADQGGQIFRYDNIEVRELDTGKLLHSWSSRDHFSELARRSGHPLLVHADPNGLAQITGHPEGVVIHEYTHMNAIEEIPANESCRKEAALCPPNYIAYAIGPGLGLVFGPELNNILWSIHLGNTHDLQLLPNGNILYYDNDSAEFRDGPSPPYVSLVERNPLTKAVRWKFSEALDAPGSSMSLGGVQFLDENSFLYSGYHTNSHGQQSGYARIVDRGGKLVREVLLPVEQSTLLPIVPARVKRNDLGRFLRENKS